VYKLYRCQRFTTSQLKDQSWVQNRELKASRKPPWFGTGLSGGAPDSVRCTRRPRAELLSLGIFQEPTRYNSPDCPVYTGQCPVLHQDAALELASLGNLIQPLRYNSPDCPVCTGLSGEPRSNGYLRANGYLQAHSMRASGAQSSGAPILAHRTVNSSCPVCTGHPGGPRIQKLQRSESNGSDDVAGAPDCPVRPSPAASPTATKLDGGYKYHPNRPLQGVGVQATFQVI
jgi:hypothetical protein